MEEIENKIKVVVEMLHSDIAWEYQRFKSHNEEKSINSFVSREAALSVAKKMILEQLDRL